MLNHKKFAQKNLKRKNLIVQKNCFKTELGRKQVSSLKVELDRQQRRVVIDVVPVVAVVIVVDEALNRKNLFCR